MHMHTLAMEFLESYRFKFFWPSARSIHFNSCAYELLKPKNFSKCREISPTIVGHDQRWLVLDHVKSFRVLVVWIFIEVDAIIFERIRLLWGS